ncbi:MAG: restriction endonuclease subunit S [Chloroflexi bacterium]|nr:restriction endonuclease subunit S [Chloroflexota bacterium]
MEVTKSYKQTEVGVIPEDWEVAALDSLGRPGRPAIKAGPFGSSITKNTYVEEGYKVYGQEQVIRGDYLYGDYYISRDRYDELRSCAVQPGDILLSLVGTAGRVLVIPPGAPAGIINPRLIRFSFDQRVIVSAYFRFLFETQAYQAVLARIAQGGTMGVLNAGLLRTIRIALPPLPEQTAIAAALSDADALINNLKRLIAKKRSIKQGAMQQLLTGKKRLPGFRGEWETKRLGDVVEKFVNGGTPSTQVERYWCGDIPWVTGADILYQKVSEIRRFITREAVENSSTNVIKKGNLLLVSRTGVGKLALAPFDIAVSQDFTGVYVRKGQTTTEYLYRYLDFNQSVLQSQNQGTSIRGITRDTLSAIEVVLPPTLGEQTAIAQVLSDMDAESEALEAKLAKARMVKQGMMQELLTGRRRLV